MDNFSINLYDGVILDFDGTMCFLFHDYDLSKTVEQIISEIYVLGVDVSNINDPFDAFNMILCQSITDDLKMRALTIVDKLLAKAECEAVKDSNVVHGLCYFISQLRQMKIPFGIATNNGDECVKLFLKIHGIDDCISINGRISNQPELLKPNPWSIIKTAGEMKVELSKLLFIGDTPRDWEASKNAGCDFIGIAPTEKKRERFDRVSYGEPLLTDYYDLI